jgi:hypothetical protein
LREDLCTKDLDELVLILANMVEIDLVEPDVDELLDPRREWCSHRGAVVHPRQLLVMTRQVAQRKRVSIYGVKR